MLVWNRFVFFDSERLKEESEEDIPIKIFKEFEASTTCNADQSLAFGDKKGVIRMFEKGMKIKKNFQAFKDSVVSIVHPKELSPPVIIALGHDVINYPCIKIFSLEDDLKSKGSEVMPLVKEIQIVSRGASSPQIATSLATMDDGSQISIGTQQGSVFLVQGDIVRRPQVVLLRASGPEITGLHYLSSASVTPSLFVLTASSVDSIFIKNRNQKVSLEKEMGSSINCSVLDTNGNRLLVGRDKAVYEYKQDVKGICFGFDKNKQRVEWHKEYLILVTKDGKRSHSVTVYDLKNKFIAFGFKTDPVASIVSQWDSIYVITETGVAFRLSEKDLQTKMEILQRKHLYSLAIALASSKGKSEEYINAIYKKSADHKQTKGDYAGAMSDYLKTIGFLEPSYVIRKFLDAQRITHLATYLEELNAQNLAGKEHTTLLLKCYTKLKQPEKLEKFIEGSITDFDVDAAIEVCHKAGHYKQARTLSERAKHHEWYLRITFDDLKATPEGLKYIQNLSPELQKRYIMQYGRVLVEANPEETTVLLSNLCGRKTPKASRTPADDFLHLYLSKPRYLLKFLRSVVDEVPKQSSIVYNMLFDLYLSVHLNNSASEKRIEENGDTKRPQKETKLTEKQRKEREENYSKAMQLLKSQVAVYDENQALITAKKYKFEKGMIYLYEKLRLFGEILQYYMETGNHRRLIRACMNHGTSDPDLWLQALKYFAAKPEPMEDEIAQILEHIQDPGVNIAPLMVLKILSSHASKPFSVVKDYVMSILQREGDAIEEDERAIQKFQKETIDMRKEIEDLTTKPTTFMPSRDLMLPAIHFLCKHSYHEQVIGSRECPKCAPEYRSVMEIKEQVKQSASQHELFFKMLEGSSDGFGVVAEYFGRGILEIEGKK